MGKKKTPKRRSAKKKPAKSSKPRRTEVVVRVQNQTRELIPTTTELTEPIKDGRKLTIPKTWISSEQLIRLTEKTPPAQVFRRKGKGGQMWDYVAVSYVQRVLDYVFGWNWDFEIVQHGREGDHIWVLGRLTVRSADGKKQIVKTQFGRSEVKYLKGTKNMLDFGNDLKSASSDALKKCASMLGIARDVFGKSDYREESGKDPIEPHDHREAAQPVHTTEVADETFDCHGARKGGCPEGASISKPARDYSVKIYGKPLCGSCQKNATPIKK